MQHSINQSVRQLTLRIYGCSSTHLIQRLSSKINVDVDPTLEAELNHAAIKPRNHPGIIRQSHFELPAHRRETLRQIVGDFPIKKVLRDSQQLNRYIQSRHPPPTPTEIANRQRNIIEEINSKMPIERLEMLSDEDRTRWQRKREAELNKRLSQRTYAWKRIEYGRYESIVYAVARAAHEYAVLKRILTELSQRDPTFNPRSFFDFGSGIGTGMWASSELWKDSIFEYYNVDRSREMNELSELILRDGHDNKQLTLRNIFYRQFLPALQTKYDLVIISHTLFELANVTQRQEILLNLWRKCDGYMVIVEEGSRRGSELIEEARQFLLQSESNGMIHTLAPCPHDVRCPRLSSAEDRTPCNFEISYLPLRLTTEATSHRHTGRYSYVILKRGTSTDATKPWPRIVRPTLVRSRHAICRLCTNGGNLQEVIFTAAKHGKSAYSCAKVSRWGDRLPMEIGKQQEQQQDVKTSSKQSIEEES